MRKPVWHKSKLDEPYYDPETKLFRIGQQDLRTARWSCDRLDAVRFAEHTQQCVALLYLHLKGTK